VSADLDLDFVRSRFPGLETGWALFDNAGGSQILGTCLDRVAEHGRSAFVQLGASYELSRLADRRIEEATAALAQLVGARDEREVVVGSSTSQLLLNLSVSMDSSLKPGDEIIVTDCDHEANITPWLRQEARGVKLTWWRTNRETLRLEEEDLRALLTDQTRLVAFTAASNLIGSIHPVERLAAVARKAGAWTCVDAVALAPHRLLDAAGWDVDFLSFSTYKVYGPHQAVLCARLDRLRELQGVNHFFLQDELPYKMQPGGVNHELVHALGAVPAYLAELGRRCGAAETASPREAMRAAFGAVAVQEELLAERLLGFLRERAGVRIWGEGSSDRALRVPTVSFTVDGRRSSEIPPLLDERRVAVRWGDFYACRLVEALGLEEQDGVIRASAVHYNSLAEMDRLVEALDAVL
jgi:cysteine desulfurase family protein (TIGR01976 family)